jgi:hypothetical protein
MVGPSDTFAMAIGTTPNVDSPLSTGFGYSSHVPILVRTLY